MNRAWDALLGLAALGAAAVAYDVRPIDWPDGPIYVTEAAPLTASECRGWQSRAQRRHMAGFPGSREAFEGFSRLQGACHPQDQDRGRALIEASIAKGAGRYLMVEYVMALRAVGDIARASKEFPLAAEVMRARIALQWTPLSWADMVAAANEEYRIEFEARDWAALQATLDFILARGPLLKQEEFPVIGRITRAMINVDYVEGMFQTYRVQRSGRYRPGKPFDVVLSVAASCGHTEAIRDFARLVVSRELPDDRKWTASINLLWLHARTGAEAALLDDLARMQGWIERDRERAIRFRESQVREHCRSAPKLPS
ncbi:MAG: hypothetical protein NBV67_16610 [Tagaea sp.]|nr:hypothetical protein [Tagaea sp.]